VPKAQRFKTGAGQSAALPVGVALGFIILPVTAWLFDEPRPVVWGFAGLALLIFFRRLTAGLTEDLKTGASRREILRRRLLLDRAVE
jgi:hypothetical protein